MTQSLKQKSWMILAKFKALMSLLIVLMLVLTAVVIVRVKKAKRAKEAILMTITNHLLLMIRNLNNIHLKKMISQLLN